MYRASSTVIYNQIKKEGTDGIRVKEEPFHNGTCETSSNRKYTFHLHFIYE